MTIEAERITRLREALEQIGQAGIDAADLAPAWAAAALAADDQQAQTAPNPPPLNPCDDCCNQPSTETLLRKHVPQVAYLRLSATPSGFRAYALRDGHVYRAEENDPVLALRGALVKLEEGNHGPRHRFIPSWYRPEYLRLEASGPLLQACATHGMTAAEALHELVKRHEQLFAHTVHTAEHSVPAVTVEPMPAPVCDTCNDTHLMELEERGKVPCTSCPRPCPDCAMGSRLGAYCTTTPCPCSCHKED